LAAKDNLIWIDLEMTGLDPDKDLILEIATVVTNKHLEVLAEGPVLALHQPDSVLSTMDEWNSRQHGASGLAQRCRDSHVDGAYAERVTLDFLGQHVPPGASPMCGNSICQDRRFLVRHMPNLARFFHYRNLDVSSLKILAQLWRPDMAAKFEKESTHLALTDIYDSINELKFYREQFLRLEPG
jgi:oligoribonuclease